MWRGNLEEKVVLEVLEMDTIAAAFEFLRERLDPEKDVFPQPRGFGDDLATRRTCHGFFRAVCRGGNSDRTDAKASVHLSFTQMPSETQPRLNEWNRTQEDELTEEL